MTINISSKNTLLLLMLAVMTTSDGVGQIFKEVSKPLGIDFKHDSGFAGLYHFIEMNGGGVAWFDYDNDDLIDLFLVNGTNGKNKLFKNATSQFIDVSETMGVTNQDGYSTGVCSADINQDGWVDFLLTTYGADVLFLNQKGQTFKQVKLDNDKSNDKDKIQPQWSTNCAFADLDNDGDLDLYVARYSQFNMDGNKTCQIGEGTNRGYCNPNHYPGQTDGLYFNDGKGHFSAALDRGINTELNDRAFGVIISDFDQDNDMDIYVGNDTTNNRLYKNDGKGFFTDTGLLSGIAINIDGKAESSMGIDIGDVDRDGLQDIVISHFSMETNTIYQNYGDSFFSDMTQAFGITQSSFMSMGWGIEFADINNNGYIDMIVANGHINDFINEADSRQNYNQLNQVFLNNKGKNFKALKAEEAFTKTTLKSSRGLAVADWNNDGKIDVAINSVDETIEVFENTIENKNNFIGLKLIGDTINTSAIGAVATIKLDDAILRKEVISGGSYLSQSDFRLVFGLAQHNGPVEVNIKWPDGKKSQHTIKNLNQYHVINYNQ